MTPTDEDFRAFVVARQAALHRTAVLLTGDPALAQDLVQSALLASWPRWARLMRDGGGEAYVRRVMANTCSRWRSRRWRDEVATAEPPDTVEAASGDPELRRTVVRALLALPPRQRAAVVFRYFDDLTEAQTAAALGCSVGTVKSQTSKGLARLRQNPAVLDLLHEGATP